MRSAEFEIEPGRVASGSGHLQQDQLLLQGFHFFRGIRRLLRGLRPCADHPNRRLFFDEYVTAVLFYFFNPTITSLRALQRVTNLAKVQRALGIRRMSLGSMSESVRVFEPGLVARVFEELAARAPGRRMDPRLGDIRRILTVVDATILRALPRMTWAVWLRETNRGVKAHLQFEVLPDTPVKATLTSGRASEVAQLKANLESGRLYVMDRGYRDFELMQAILEAGSSFLLRLHENAVYEVVEEHALTAEAEAAHLAWDRTVRLGGPRTREKLDRPLRLIAVDVPAQPPRGLGYPVKRVSSKKTFRRSLGQPHRLLLVSDCKDLPADVIALIYQHRWKVELFFRLMKSVIGLRHLLSDSYEGVSIQVYCALIATLLLAEYTGLRPNKRLYELTALYLQGWVTDEELTRHLARLRQEAAAKKP